MAFPLSDTEHAAIKARINGQDEMIVAAAIRYRENGCNVVVMVERPGRHGDCINFMHYHRAFPYEDQGFITNRGRFVDRVEAAEIVAASGQGSKREGINGLFSEDMWNDWDDENRRPAPRADAIF